MPTPGQCRNCYQGYTTEGYAASPDHIVLCPLHTDTSDLLGALKKAYDFIQEHRLRFYDCQTESELEISNLLFRTIAKVEGR